jgi:hypothetical protein
VLVDPDVTIQPQFCVSRAQAMGNALRLDPKP